MTLVLDAGALIAIERGMREVDALLAAELRASRVPITHGGVLGQVWRGGGARQVRLNLAIRGVQIQPLDAELGKRAGTLLARSRQSDVVDAALVLLAQDGDMILTSDPDDLEPLARAAGLHVDIVEV